MPEMGSISSSTLGPTQESEKSKDVSRKIQSSFHLELLTSLFGKLLCKTVHNANIWQPKMGGRSFSVRSRLRPDSPYARVEDTEVKRPAIPMKRPLDWIRR